VVTEQERDSQSGDLAAELRLRPERPPVTRLSRKVLVGLAAIAAVVVSGALVWGLYQGRGKQAGSGELYNTENKPTPDGLAGLPRDYTGVPQNGLPPTGSGVPRLGPPLPGDLGRPILNAQGAAPGAPAIDAEQQRLTQETEAARTSRLFATTNTRERPTTPIASPAPAGQGVATQVGLVETPPLDPDSLLNMQDRKLAFLNGAVDRKTVSPDRLANPASRFVVQAGAVIPAALITGIRSDLPGQVTAQVTEHVYDSPTGRYLLIPQGAKLIGLYDSQISFGQDRLLLVWTRLIMPNGRSIYLSASPVPIRKDLLDWRTRLISTGAGCSWRPRFRPSSALAQSSEPPTTTTRSWRRSGAAAATLSRQQHFQLLLHWPRLFRPAQTTSGHDNSCRSADS
jgi:type IV secretion system protein TrbI